MIQFGEFFLNVGFLICTIFLDFSPLCIRCHLPYTEDFQNSIGCNQNTFDHFQPQDFGDTIQMVLQWDSIHVDVRDMYRYKKKLILHFLRSDPCCHIWIFILYKRYFLRPWEITSYFFLIRLRYLGIAYFKSMNLEGMRIS